MNENKISQRRQSRIKVLCALYNSEIGHTGIENALINFTECGEYEPSVGDYADILANGVMDKSDELDDIIGEHLKIDWVVERLTVIDRIILKMAVYEMRYSDDVPVAVAINEAVELAKEYSTEESPKFINGVLGSLVKNNGHIADYSDQPNG